MHTRGMTIGPGAAAAVPGDVSKQFAQIPKPLVAGTEHQQFSSWLRGTMQVRGACAAESAKFCNATEAAAKAPAFGPAAVNVGCLLGAYSSSGKEHHATLFSAPCATALQDMRRLVAEQPKLDEARARCTLRLPSCLC